MGDPRIRLVISRFPNHYMRIGQIGNLLITDAYTNQIRVQNPARGNTTYGNGLRIFVLIGNIMKSHDCRKRTGRSRKAEK